MKMFPVKHNNLDMTELSRLFPNRTENVPDPRSPSIYSNASPPLSPFNQTWLPNRSSSSTDSTSPESFSDNTFFSSPDYRMLSKPSSPDYRLSTPSSSIPETPFNSKRRPIIGRKILSSTSEQPSTSYEMSKWSQDLEFAKSIWQAEEPTTFSQTSASGSSIFAEQKNYTQNVFYELFPAENRGFNIKTPVNRSCTPVPNQNQAGNSHPVMPFRTKAISPKFSVVPKANSSFSHQEDSFNLCTFCRKNGETPMVYMTHTVKEQVGNKFVVTCPILRSHVCVACGATGDNAHTITYCPVLRHRNHGLPLQSTTITLKNTPLKSNGRKRY